MIKTTLLAASLLALATSSASAAPIDDAETAYADYDVSRAETLYHQIVDDPATTALDKGKAQTGLARIGWLVDDNAAAALERLATSLPYDPEPCPAALLYARILNGTGRWSAVPRLLAPFAARCASLRPDLIVEIARSQVLRAAALPAGHRTAALIDARVALAAMPPLVRATLGAGRIAMDIGLLAGDGEEALRGWREYLWLGTRNQPNGSPFGEAQIGTAFLAGTRSAAPPDAALALTDILTRTGFADELQWLRRDHGLEKSRDPRALRLSAYLAMRARLKATVLLHDRAYARSHREDADAYDKHLMAILADGARAAGETVEGAPWAALNRLWGIGGQSGTINGVGGIILGHSVEERDAPVSQNGRNARIRLVEVDNMIENSFSAWLWDNGSGPGGWAATGLIYQVRPGYVRGALRAMAQATPGLARDEALAEANRLTAADPVRLTGADPVALPGLGARLTLQAIDEVAAQVRARTTDLPGFLAAFRIAWWDADINASIILHEGRHVLDIAEYTGSCELKADELEYRAKLVEVGLSDHPRLRLAAVLGSEMSAESSHGQANRRVAALFRDWIMAHAGEIVGYDRGQPAALQVDKLSNDQIKAIMHGADPEGSSRPKCVPAGT